MIRKLASAAVATAIASVGLVGAAGGAGASVIDPGGAGSGCTTYNVYSQKDMYTITVSYRVICGTKRVGLEVTGYTLRSGYSGWLCDRIATANYTASYLATPSCNVSSPSSTCSVPM